MTIPTRNATGRRLRSSVGIKSEFLLVCFGSGSARLQEGTSSNIRCPPEGGRYKMPLAARSEPLDQRKRQAGLLHAFLNRSDIIRHTPKFNDVMIQVGDGEGSARISIPWLADRAGIQQIARPRFQSQGGKLRAMIRAQLNHADLPRAIGKPDLMMLVPEKCYIRPRFQKGVPGLPRDETLFVLILVPYVNQRNAVHRDRPGRQSL